MKNDIQRIAAIGCDHAGFPYKKTIEAILKDRKFHVLDMGTNSTDSVDYPDFVHPVAEAIENGHAEIGFLICGSGNGVCMTVNKYKSVRGIIAWNREVASLGRKHNNANVLCLPARFVSRMMVSLMVNTFLDTAFEGGRHQRRIDKIY